MLSGHLHELRGERRFRPLPAEAMRIKDVPRRHVSKFGNALTLVGFHTLYCNLSAISSCLIPHLLICDIETRTAILLHILEGRTVKQA